MPRRKYRQRGDRGRAEERKRESIRQRETERKRKEEKEEKEFYLSFVKYKAERLTESDSKRAKCTIMSFFERNKRKRNEC